MGAHATGRIVVGQVIANAAVRYPNKEAYLCASTGRRPTFRQVNDRCNRLANGLRAIGLRKGDRVAFLCSNRVEMVEIYFALAKSGFVGLPLNYRLAPAEMAELMRATDVQALIVERCYVEMLAPHLAGLPKLVHRVSLGEGDSFGRDYETLLARAPEIEPPVEVNDGDPFYFNLTSGTTGLPKCYLVNHYNCTASVGLITSFDLTSRDVAMTLFPMYGRVGFIWAMVSALYGIRNVLANFEPDNVLRLIDDEGVTIVNLVPTMAVMLLASPMLGLYSRASLRAVAFAGAPLPELLRRTAHDLLCKDIYEYYGMQETGTLVLSRPEDRLRKPGSVGRPVVFSEIRIVDSTGRDLHAGESGEILGRAPSAVTSYYDNPEQSAETFRDGWVHTGDIGYLDDEGYLYISGRLKEVIVTGGQNVYAVEVEELIQSFPGVAEAAVVGLPHPLWGEAVTAIVVPVGGSEIDGEALIKYCRTRLAGFKTPKRVVFCSDLPRTPTGKVQKFKLVERYGTMKLE